MDTYEKYPAGGAYLLFANGELVGPALLHLKDESFLLESVGAVKDISDYSSKETADGLVLERDGSEIMLKSLSLGDAKTIFPDTIKKFKSVDSLTASVTKEIMNANSYTPAVESTEDVLSFTVDADDNVLELVRVTSEGEMYYREAADWVLVGEDEDAPTIFDQTMIDIDAEEVDLAVDYYDTNVNTKESISKDEILEFAALVQ